MEWIERIGATVDYIENHLDDDIMYDEVAKIACCSMHQFGRIFSYIVGIPLSEYIRRRRLTIAAMDLKTYTIPENKWVVFTVRGSLNGKEHPIDAMWTRITTEWFPTETVH